MGKTASKFSTEVRERAVRLVLDHEAEHPSFFGTDYPRCSSAASTSSASWALVTLEWLANMFLALERERHLPLYIYKDIELSLNRAYKLALQTSLYTGEYRDDVNQLDALSRVARAGHDARHRRRHRRTKSAQDWYVEKLLYVWESCGGVTRTKGKVIDLIVCASAPVLKAGKHKPLTASAVRGIVRKLLTERAPNS